MSVIQNNIASQTIGTPQSIIEYARSNNLLNMAENKSSLPCSPELENRLKEYIIPYANTNKSKFGLPELRQVISEKTKYLYDSEYDAETEITITSGVKQSIFSAILALLKEGDEVVMFEPAHQGYRSAIEAVGARPVFVSLKPPTFEVDWTDVLKVIRLNTKMIILNTPHYPAGSTLTEIDMLRLQKIINGTNIIILSDETYEHIVFDGEMHQSVALYPKLKKQSVVVSSFNESLLVPYWDVSYCMAPQKLMKEIRKVLDSMGGEVSTPFQMAIKDVLDPMDKYRYLADTYQKKRDLFCNGLVDSNIEIVPMKGSYFQLINIDKVTTKNDKDFALELMQEYGLATIPCSFYFHQNYKTKYLKVNLSVSDEDILEAITILRSLPIKG